MSVRVRSSYRACSFLRISFKPCEPNPQVQLYDPLHFPGEAPMMRSWPCLTKGQGRRPAFPYCFTICPESLSLQPANMCQCHSCLTEATWKEVRLSASQCPKVVHSLSGWLLWVCSSTEGRDGNVRSRRLVTDTGNKRCFLHSLRGDTSDLTSSY